MSDQASTTSTATAESEVLPPANLSRTAGKAVSRWYGCTFLALVVHQIDAAYWHEWEMFRVPGGIQGFLAFNAIAVGLLIFGYRQVITHGRFATASAVFCGALGLITAGLHLGFALAGFDEFHLPLSIATIAACFICGAGLLSLLLRRGTNA